MSERIDTALSPSTALSLRTALSPSEALRLSTALSPHTALSRIIPRLARRSAAIVAALGFVALIAPAPGLAGSTAEVAGVQFDESIDLGTTRLRLSGAGLLRYKVLFKGYAAALYLEEGVPTQAALSEGPRRLEIEYFWAIPASAFVRATEEGMGRNVDARSLDRLGDRVDQLSRLYRNVQPGDRYSLTYMPGIGTELSLNGESMGVVEGEDFAAALFSIWLGDEPFDAGLKARLLGRS